MLIAPFWRMQLPGPGKSFEKNPIFGSRLLNRLGLHVERVVMAHGVTRLRGLFLASPLPRVQRRQYREQGFLLIRDFLSAGRLAALDAAVRAYRGEPASWHRIESGMGRTAPTVS